MKPKVALVLDLNSKIQDNSNNINNPLDFSSSSIISQKIPEPYPKASVDTTTQLQSNINPQVFENVSLKDYLQSFERRNSDSTLVVNKNPSSTSKINLMQEIKKLTDYLFKIKNQEPKEIVDQQQQLEDDQKILEQSKTIDTITKTVEHEQTNKETEMNLKNSEHKQKIEEQIENNNHDKSEDDKENVTADSNSKETENLTPSTKSRNITELFKKFTNMTDKKDEDKANNAPWPVSNKRTKFRVNQMSSRDVPIFKVPANHSKLQKQNAIITSETLFQETIIKPVSQQSSLDSTEFMRKFQQETHTLFQKHHIFQQENMKRSQRFAEPPHSISFELGTIHSMEKTLEQRALNSITSFFQLHAKNGTTVKQIQKQIESKNK